MMTYLEYAAEFVVIYLILGYAKSKYYQWRFKKDKNYPFNTIKKE